MKKIYQLICVACLGAILFTACSKDSGSSNFDSGQSNGSNPGVGQGGSLARFIIVGNYLYVVDNQILSTYSLDNEGLPSKVSQTSIGFNIETIFNMGDKLLIGSQSAMYIYNISDPSNPNYVAMASHLRACDPVVAKDSTAYVTVRSSINNPGACGGSIDALLVYDISNIQMPILKNTIEMYNPHGLAIGNNTLYICEGKGGLKIMDVTENNHEPRLVQTIQDDSMVFIDCFIKDGYLYTMMENGFIIWDISEVQRPVKLGSILK